VYKKFGELHGLYFSLIPLLQKCRTLDHSGGSDDSCNKNQLMAIMVIGKAESITPTALSKFMNMEKGSLTTLIDSLENKGFVRRLNDPNDRRKTLLSLTSKGIDQMKATEEQSQQIFAKMTAILSESEKDEMHISLKSLVKLLKKIGAVDQ